MYSVAAAREPGCSEAPASRLVATVNWQFQLAVGLLCGEKDPRRERHSPWLPRFRRTFVNKYKHGDFWDHVHVVINQVYGLQKVR